MSALVIDHGPDCNCWNNADVDELKRSARRLRNARKAADDALDAAKAAALTALAEGVAEAVVARELGVDRMTVRKWQGKR